VQVTGTEWDGIEHVADELCDAAVICQADVTDRVEPAPCGDESALRRLIGSPQVMHDALVRVAELSVRPNIVVQVVPSAKGASVALARSLDRRGTGRDGP
jgi:hypothetical protein